MHGIFLINEAGETIASMGTENLEGDSALLGGFVSALQIFIKKISGNEISELLFGDFKLLIGKAKDNYVVTLHDSDESDAKAKNEEIIRLVIEQGDNINDGFLILINKMVSF